MNRRIFAFSITDRHWWGDNEQSKKALDILKTEIGSRELAAILILKTIAWEMGMERKFTIGQHLTLVLLMSALLWFVLGWITLRLFM